MVATVEDLVLSAFEQRTMSCFRGAVGTDDPNHLTTRPQFTPERPTMLEVQVLAEQIALEMLLARRAIAEAETARVQRALKVLGATTEAATDLNADEVFASGRDRQIRLAWRQRATSPVAMAYATVADLWLSAWRDTDGTFMGALGFIHVRNEPRFTSKASSKDEAMALAESLAIAMLEERRGIAESGLATFAARETAEEATPPSPPSFNVNMPHRMAERVLKVRADNLVAEIKDLPPAERFRLIADFIDKGMHDFAVKTARYALSQLEG